LQRDAGKKAADHGVRTLTVKLKGPVPAVNLLFGALSGRCFTITSIRDVNTHSDNVFAHQKARGLKPLEFWDRPVGRVPNILKLQSGIDVHTRSLNY